MTQQEMKKIVKEARENVISTSTNQDGEELILVATEEGCDIELKMKEIVNHVREGSLSSVVNIEGEKLIFSATKEGCKIVVNENSGFRRVLYFDLNGRMTYMKYDGKWRKD